MDKVAEIKRLYLTATKPTIERHVEQAIALLKSMESDEDRERAAVFMDGLAQMRSEWGLAPKAAAGRGGAVTDRQGRNKARRQ